MSGHFLRWFLRLITPIYKVERQINQLQKYAEWKRYEMTLVSEFAIFAQKLSNIAAPDTRHLT